MKIQIKAAFDNLRQKIKAFFSLKEDTADNESIDISLRAGSEMKGTNLCILIFAIFIACIGLNVNSTAIVIGAMLISPLMGPIMGIGYGIGIYDFLLVRAAINNLGIAVLISLTTSSIYFQLTPLKEIQPELLARTMPTLWDVLIAFFGGLAGIVAITRKEKSNVIPGVAIATALMPPLCTAGFSLVNGHWSFFGGAFYLFTINGVFIALASAIMVRAFHLKKKIFIDQKIANRVKNLTLAIALLTVIPSIYLAYNLVHAEVFKSNAMRFIANEIESDRISVIKTEIDPKMKMIKVTLIGEFFSEEKLKKIIKHLPSCGLAQAKLEIYQQTLSQ